MSNEFLIKEFEMLRKKMDECVAEFRALERYAILASAAVYSFAFTSTGMPYKNLIFWIPLLIALLGALRAWALSKYIGLIGSYIAELEVKSNAMVGLGYEQYLARAGVKREDIAAVVIWGSLIIFNAIVWWEIARPGS